MDKKISGDPLDEMTLIDKAFADVYSRCWIDTPEYGSVHIIEAEFRRLEAENARLREALKYVIEATEISHEWCEQCSKTGIMAQRALGESEGES